MNRIVNLTRNKWLALALGGIVLIYALIRNVDNRVPISIIFAGYLVVLFMNLGLLVRGKK